MFLTLYQNSIILHLKKSMKLIFCEKNEAKISGFAVTEKAPSPWKKNFFEKNIRLSYFCRNDLQNSVRNFFKNKWVLRYLSFGDFKVLKNCSLQ